MSAVVVEPFTRFCNGCGRRSAWHHGWSWVCLSGDPLARETISARVCSATCAAKLRGKPGLAKVTQRMTHGLPLPSGDSAGLGNPSRARHDKHPSFRKLPTPGGE